MYEAKNSGRNKVVKYRNNNSVFASVHFDWNSKWECGNEEIDKQHRELLNLNNKVINNLFLDIDSDRNMEYIDILLDHIKYHFKYEENIMKDVVYEDYDKHFKNHNELILKVMKLKEDYKSKNFKESEVFSLIIDDIIIGHMLNLDKEFFSNMDFK